jgi:hypothetical protein
MTGVVRVIAGLMVSAAVAAAPPPVGSVPGTPPSARDGVSQTLVVTCVYHRFVLCVVITGIGQSDRLI